MKFKYFEAAAACLVFLTAIVILKIMASWLQPLFIAVFLYYISTPLIDFLIEHKWPSLLAHAVVVGGAVVILVGMAWGIAANFDTLVAMVPNLQVKAHGFLTDFSTALFSTLPSFHRKVQRLILRYDLLTPSPESFRGIVSFSTALLTGGTLTIFFLTFIFHEAKNLPGQLTRAFGDEQSQKITKILAQINRDIIKYIYVKFVASLITAGVSFSILLVFDVPLPALWASVVFATNFIPYIGSIFACFLITAVALLNVQSTWMVFVIAGSFVLTDMLVGNYWEPKYAGQHLNMSPLLILMSLCFWGWLWGPVGLILAVPILVSLRYVFENIPSLRPFGIMMSYERRKRERPLFARSSTAVSPSVSELANSKD